MQADKNVAGRSFELNEGSKLTLTLTSSVGTGTSLRFEILFMVTSDRLKGPEMLRDNWGVTKTRKPCSRRKQQNVTR